MVFCVFIFIFMFRNNVIREQLGQKNFRSCHVSFFEIIIPKVLDHNDVQSSLSTITNHLDNGIWKAPYNWRVLLTLMSSLHQDIELIIVCFSFSQTSLVFKFNLMLIEQFLPRFIHLSIFWYWVLKFIQYFYAFFKRASKFSSASMLFFCEGGLQLQNVIIFLFSMKH